MKILGALALVLTAMLFVDFSVWTGVSYGFSEGYTVASTESQVKLSEDIRLPQTEGSYLHLAKKYKELSLLTFLLFVILALRNYSDGLTAWWIVGGPILVLLLYNLRHLLGLKDVQLNDSLMLPYNSLLLLSASYDWLAIWLVIGILVCEICRTVVHFLRKGTVVAR